MSLKQAHAFRDFVSQNEEAQKQIAEIVAAGANTSTTAKIAAVGAAHGYDFTAAEAKECIRAAADMTDDFGRHGRLGNDFGKALRKTFAEALKKT